MGDQGLRSVAYRGAVLLNTISPVPPAGTDKRLTPIKTHRLGAILPGRLDRIGLDLVPAARDTK
jgi:hypothetical protein